MVVVCFESYCYTVVLVKCLDRGRDWIQAIDRNQMSALCISNPYCSFMSVHNSIGILFLRIILLPLLHTSVHSSYMTSVA